MARRPDGRSRFDLSPRGRLIAGWVAALVIIGGIALAVRLTGGNADGTSVVPPGSGSPSAATQQTGSVRFGTALDSTTQEIAVAGETARFIRADTFAYSYRPEAPPPTTVWVEVRREADGSGEVVQAPAPHALADDALVIGFEVPAAALFEDFGTGPFQMRIYLAADGEPVATGSFELVAATPTQSP